MSLAFPEKLHRGLGSVLGERPAGPGPGHTGLGASGTPEPLRSGSHASHGRMGSGGRI